MTFETVSALSLALEPVALNRVFSAEVVLAMLCSLLLPAVLTSLGGIVSAEQVLR